MALVDERGCRRDIRSNGWIDFRGSSLFQNRSGRRNEFSSFGADFLRSAISPGPKPSVKSGPDVFADALVPPGRLRYPERHRSPGRASPQARASSAWLLSFPNSFADRSKYPQAWLCVAIPPVVVMPRDAGYQLRRRTPDNHLRSGRLDRPHSSMTIIETLAQWLSFCQIAG